MTDKEAIKWLNKNRPCISMTCNKENADNINIATNMAIKALEEINNIRWTDKVSIRYDGDIIDFDGRLIGHINMEDIDGAQTYE